MRTILSDVGEYEKQAMKIRKEVRRNYQGISAGAVQPDDHSHGGAESHG